MIPAVQELAVLYKAAANREKSLAMSKYMKGLFVFYGIPSPLRKDIQKKWYDSTIKNSLIQTHAHIKNAKLDNAMIGNHASFDGNFTSISIGDYSVLE